MTINYSNSVLNYSAVILKILDKQQKIFFITFPNIEEDISSKKDVGSINYIKMYLELGKGSLEKERSKKQ